MPEPAKVVTHLAYTDLFDVIENDTLVVPTSILRTVESIEIQIERLLREMNPIELIQFSSFLNMICQSYGSDASMVRGISLLEETGLIEKGRGFINKIVFHRENLLNLIGQILLKNISGVSQLTGVGHEINQQKYTRAILLVNNLLAIETGSSPMSSEEMILKDYFIREWPHYYLSETAQAINGHRIVRYRYCYESILPNLKEKERKMMQQAVSIFENSVGVSLPDYMHAITALFGWFLDWPLRQRKNPPTPGQPKFGFDFKNIDSFYISSKAFEKDPAFVKTIKALAKDITMLKTSAIEEQGRERDRIQGPNQLIRIFFENPVFKISENDYCIIDLKFILENVCGGLLWRLRTQENIQDFKSAYGYLMESYFQFLIKNIFVNSKVTFGDGKGADAIVEEGDKILVIEFTTENYRMSSLYNNSREGFLDDAYRILFNTGPADERGRNKNDKGKMLKLEDYIAGAQQPGKTVIPVLVTENLIGTPDLLDKFSNFYTKEIFDKKLSNLKQNPPIFLCLDDLETFWGLHDPKEAVEAFANFTKQWIQTNKGPHFHNATAGIVKFAEEQKGEAIINNKSFSEFFSSEEIYKRT